MSITRKTTPELYELYNRRGDLLDLIAERGKIGPILARELAAVNDRIRKAESDQARPVYVAEHTPENARPIIARYVCSCCGGQLESVPAYPGAEYVLCYTCGIDTPGYITPEFYARKHAPAQAPAEWLLTKIKSEVES
jgi:hypothetical protein